jgi:predicted ester cyclase
MSDPNTAIVRRFLDELWNKHHLDSVEGLTLYPRNPAARPFLAAFPDVQATIDDQIAAGDNVVSRVTVQATHQGGVAGVAQRPNPCASRKFLSIVWKEASSPSAGACMT